MSSSVFTTCLPSAQQRALREVVLKIVPNNKRRLQTPGATLTLSKSLNTRRLVWEQSFWYRAELLLNDLDCAVRCGTQSTADAVARLNVGVCEAYSATRLHSRVKVVCGGS